MQFDIITIFPNLFNSFLNESLIYKSQQKKVNKFCVHDLRKWSQGKHKQVDPVKSFKKKFNRVDDRPYGGGAGMILMAEPIIEAVKEIKLKNSPCEMQSNFSKRKIISQGKKLKVILLSPAGKQFNQAVAKKF